MLTDRARDIVRETAIRWGVRPATLTSRDRTRWVCFARFEAVYRMRTELGHSFPRIGRALGRDHSTICHAYHRALDMRSSHDAGNDQSSQMLETPMR